MEDATLYIVYESAESIRIDTVVCDGQGRFSAFHQQEEELQVITFFYHDRNQRFSVYPEAGKPVKIKGDARYPNLLQIKGGQINNKLSEFKKKAAPLLKELAVIQKNNPSLSGEGAMQLTTLKLEIRKTVEQFVTKNPKELASAVLISEYFANSDEIEHAEDLFRLLSPELNDHYFVKNLWQEIEKPKASRAGAKAPDFTVTNLHGQTFTIDSFANKYFILAFTALWCDMCQTEVMKLDDIATKYPKDSLDILLICLDDEPDEIRELVRQDSIQWNLVADSAGQSIQLFESYNVNTLPKCFFIDKNGVILLNTMNGEELKQSVEEIMVNGKR
jgi:peroxiredoxin